jgi:hypothetical protein
MEKKKSEKLVNVCVVMGVEGPSVSINDYRVAGNKPWGGGKILLDVNVPLSDIKYAIKNSTE